VRLLLESGRAFSVIAPGSVWKTKRWKVSNFIAYCQAHRQQWPDEELVFIGAAGDAEVLSRITREVKSYPLSQGTNLADVLALVHGAQSVVCNDSMILHVASAFAVPTTAIFCATTPEMGFGPWQNPYAAVLGARDLNCRPCGRHGGQCCPIRTEECRERPLPIEVLQAMKHVRHRKYGVGK
jgi:heptosyltransferase-2